jgi:hypothetical protein
MPAIPPAAPAPPDDIPLAPLVPPMPATAIDPLAPAELATPAPPTTPAVPVAGPTTKLPPDPADAVPFGPPPSVVHATSALANSQQQQRFVIISARQACPHASRKCLDDQ